MREDACSGGLDVMYVDSNCHYYAQCSVRDESLECRFTPREAGIYDLTPSHLLHVLVHSQYDLQDSVE